MKELVFHIEGVIMHGSIKASYEEKVMTIFQCNQGRFFPEKWLRIKNIMLRESI